MHRLISNYTLKIIKKQNEEGEKLSSFFYFVISDELQIVYDNAFHLSKDKSVTMEGTLKTEKTGYQFFCANKKSG